MQYQLTKLKQQTKLNLMTQPEQQSVFQAEVFDQHHPARQQMESFIREAFAHYYQADILHFYPYLLGAFDAQQPCAAVGYRHASEQRLFLEQYTESPIEQELEKISDGIRADRANNDITHTTQRKSIVEIGNLAATKPGACLHIFQLLSLYFHNSDIRWVVFTGTRAVRVVLKRLRLKAYELSPASAKQLDTKQQWGSYYSQQPVVMAMPVAQTIAPISTRYTLQIS